MNWQAVLAFLASVEPTLIPAEIAALQALDARATNPVEKAAVEALIRFLQSRQQQPA